MKPVITAYARGAELLEEAIRGLSEQEMLYRPSETSWSVKEIVIHLCDSEIAAVHRMKQVISEDVPLLVAYDQDRWAQRQQYQALDLKPHLTLFRALRESMSSILNGLNGEDFERYGIHNAVGKITLHELVAKFVDHLNGHIGQINRVLDAYRDDKPNISY